MKTYIKQSPFGAGTYVYEQNKDGLYYQVTPLNIESLFGYTEEYLIAAGYTELEKNNEQTSRT